MGIKHGRKPPTNYVYQDKPLEERRVKMWRLWPATIAKNIYLSLPRRGRWSVLRMAQNAASDLQWLLSDTGEIKKRRKVKIEDIVVFYPWRYRNSIVNYRKRYREKVKREYKGLTVCPTHRLLRAVQAFLIEDVAAHRTPADAYFVILESDRKYNRRMKPVPIYTADEAGQEVHE